MIVVFDTQYSNVTVILFRSIKFVLKVFFFIPVLCFHNEQNETQQSGTDTALHYECVWLVCFELLVLLFNLHRIVSVETTLKSDQLILAELNLEVLRLKVSV